jgi:hypothetical protein
MKAAIIVLVVASILACRDVSRSPGGPSFAVAADTGPGGCAATHCSFNTRGAAAYVSWFDPGTVSGDTGSSGGLQVYGSLSVSRSASETFLFYIVTECRPWGCTTARGGFGTIPTSDVSGNSSSMHLSTNTSGNPNFFTFAGSTGSIEVTWTANGLFEYHSNGTTQTIQPGFRQQTTGQSDDVAATASGSIVAYPIFPANSGSISANHNVTITINR